MDRLPVNLAELLLQHVGAAVVEPPGEERDGDGFGAVFAVGQEDIAAQALFVRRVGQLHQVAAVRNPDGREGGFELLAFLRGELVARLALGQRAELVPVELAQGGQPVHGRHLDLDRLAVLAQALLVELARGLPHPRFDRQRGHHTHLDRPAAARRPAPAGWRSAPTAASPARPRRSAARPPES